MTLEERVAELEQKLARYERAISVEANRVIIQKPAFIRGTLNVNGANIFTIRGESPNSAIEAGVGSICLRLDGGSGTTLYVKENGTDTTGWSTTS